MDRLSFTKAERYFGKETVNKIIDQNPERFTPGRGARTAR
jgi:hypothetical protein